MSANKTICEIHKEIEEEVIDFNAHVKSAGEESITDYLMWRWSLANKDFSHFNAKSFTRHEENSTSGADLELELWLVGNVYSLPLVIQSKKISEEYNSYKAVLSYPNGSSDQITKLLTYTNKYNKTPLYMFYSQSSEAHHWKTKDCGVFIAHANDILNFTTLPKGTRLSKTEILEKCIRFHDLFCGQVDNSSSQADLVNLVVDKLTSLNSKRERVINKYPTESLPDYVKYILDEIPKADFLDYESFRYLFNSSKKKINKLNKFRQIAVYDART